MAGATVFDGLLNYQRQQQGLIEDKQKVQENAINLQLKMQGAQTLQNENQAIKQFDPNNIDSLQAVAGQLAQGGDSQGSLSVMSEYQKLKDQQMMAQSRAVTTMAERSQVAGGIIKGMDSSPEAYQTGITQLKSNNLDPARFGLTGSYEDDHGSGRISQIATGTQTVAQQTANAEKQLYDQRALASQQLQFQKEQAQIAYQNRMANTSEGRLQEEQNRTTEKARMDQIKQNNDLLRANKIKLDLATPKPAAINDIAVSLKGDPRVDGASDSEIRTLATKLAYQAAKDRSSAYDPNDPTTEQSGEDFLFNAQAKLDKMIEKGEWGDTGGMSGLFGLIKGKQGMLTSDAAGKVQPANTNQTPAQKGLDTPIQLKTSDEYSKLKKGQLFIAPDGTKRRKS
jgi:hypothetical protein